MHRHRLLAPFLCLLSLLAGCPADPGAGSPDAPSALDGGGSADAASALDAFAESDAPSEADAPLNADAPLTADAGEAPDAFREPACPEGLGAFCEDAPCPMGFECMVGRCAPQGRQLCGGFAGAMCTEPGFSACLFFSRADFGPCLTPEERRCICDDPSRAAGFACP